MRAAKISSGVFWLLFSVLMSREAFRLPMGEMKDPGAGFFPLIVAIATGLLAVAAIFHALRERPAAPEERPLERLRWWNLVVILAGLIVYALTLTTIGFMISTFWFMLLLLKVIEPQRWIKALAAASITAVAAELFFNALIGAQIPTGLLGW